MTSDNASNSVKAFNFLVPGYTEPDDQNCLNEDNLDGDIKLETIEIENPFLKHKRCYAHSSKLVIKDAFQECGQTFQNVIAKVSKFVYHILKSIFASEFLEEISSI